MNIDIKTLEKGAVFRALLKSILNMVSNPSLLLSLFILTSLSFLDLSVIFLYPLLSFIVCFGYFQKKYSGDNFIFNLLFFKTLLNTIKQHKSFKEFIFISIILSAFSITYSYLSSVTNNTISINIYLTIIAIYINVSLSVFLFLYFISCYYHLMKNNSIFKQFSTINSFSDSKFLIFIKNIHIKNKPLFIQLFLSILGILFLTELLSSFFQSVITYDFIQNMSFSLFHHLTVLFILHIYIELVDGRKQKVKEYKIAENLG